MVGLLYKPVGILGGMLAGAVAAQLFERLWTAISDDDPADPEERDAGWGAVILTAALSGIVYGVVKALVRRGGAVGFEKMTGEWPGTETRA